MQTSEELLQSIGTEVTHLTEDAQKKFGELSNRLLALEQKADASKFGAISTGSTNDVGRTVIESAQFKSFVTNGLRSTGKISVGDIKTSLINAIGQNQPLVAADRTAIVPPVTRRLTIRDVLPSAPTSSNSIEFPKETSFTNNAAPQYSAAAYENVVKAESAMTFSLTPMPVSTVAHWIPVSNQLLDDAPAIQGYVNNRLLYGLNLKIETELLTGSGIQGHLSGLITNSTSFDTNYTTVSSDNYLDIFRKAALQLTVNDFSPDVLVVNPIDWDVAVGTKTAGTGITTGEYVWASPAFMPRQQVWGMRVIVTNSMTSGQFLCLDSSYCMVFDRAQATVEVSREHADFFIRNMSALLCETRLTLCVFNSGAVLYGGLPFGS